MRHLHLIGLDTVRHGEWEERKRSVAITKKQLLSEIGIDPGPSRLKCALLSYKVLKLALASFLGKKMPDEKEDSLL